MLVGPEKGRYRRFSGPRSSIGHESASSDAAFKLPVARVPLTWIVQDTVEIDVVLDPPGVGRGTVADKSCVHAIRAWRGSFLAGQCARVDFKIASVSPYSVRVASLQLSLQLGGRAGWASANHIPPDVG